MSRENSKIFTYAFCKSGALHHLSSFKPFAGSFLFGPLLAQFLSWGKCSKAQALCRLFSWPIVSPKSGFEVQFENPGQSKKEEEEEEEER
jgi:hypothetical protein